MKKLWLVPLLALIACAHVHLTQNCPATSTGVGFALAGSNVGNQLISMGAGMASKGGLMAKAGAATSDQATMDYTYVPIFGADSGSLVCTQPSQQTIVVASPPASIVHEQ